MTAAEAADKVASLFETEGLSPGTVRSFRTLIRRHFQQYGRVQPWRETTDPYAIVVSEIMLQQTQVERVTDKFLSFMETFPDARSLADAPLRKVLAAWQGLGYNRRAVSLQRLAQVIVNEHGGLVPSDEAALFRLPGIGHYTANAVLAFAFNRPTVFIETNIRRVFLHIFFRGEEAVEDKQLVPLIERTLDRKDPRSWYYGLMDFGTALKKEVANPNRRSRHYTRQSQFEGSRRQMRARLFRYVLASPGCTVRDAAAGCGLDEETARDILRSLVEEQFLSEKKGRFAIS